MDLSEVRIGASGRHPWELARAHAILQILGQRGRAPHAILDYGCGDGYTGREVQRAFGAARLVGLDNYLPAERCGVEVLPSGTRELIREESALGAAQFDLVLLCDVIEHVEDDVGLLRRVVERRLAPGGEILITVPAFQALFSAHDVALRHYRRYGKAELLDRVTAAGARILDHGYLFSSLLLPRALTVALERLSPPRSETARGIGGWRGGPTATRALSTFFRFENDLLLALQRRGIALPGLSAWVLSSAS